MSLNQTQINEIFAAMGLPAPSSAISTSLLAIPNTYDALNTIIALPDVATEVIPILAMFDLALGHDPVSATLASMVETNGGDIASIADQFVESQAFANVYNGGVLLSSSTIVDSSNAGIITALFVNGLGHPPSPTTLDGFFGLTLGEAFLAFSQSNAVAVSSTIDTSLTNIMELAAGIPPETTPPPPQDFTLTLGSNVLISGSNSIGTTTPDVAVVSTGNVTIDALLAPASAGSKVLVPTLNSGDLISLAGTDNVLNAQFNGSANVVNVAIEGVQTWNITQDYTGHSSSGPGTIDITGDVQIPNGTPFTDPILQGLTNLTFSDSSTTGSLNIGTNTEPVYIAPGSEGPFNFAVTVISAVGDGHNGVDVDFTGAAFTTPGSTISVDAESVGGFPVDSGGSLVIPDPICGTTGDPDNYDPNWVGYYYDSYSIASGSSSGGPSGTAIGFTNWVVNSSAAAGVGGLNIIALGGEGSTSATSLTLTDDGSNTMLYASFDSDSLGGHDWQNLGTINLAGTSGFVTLTGLEASIADGYNPSGSSYYDDIGLLANLIGPVDIIPGTGNSFYDLTAMDYKGTTAGLLAVEQSIIEGGSNTAFIDTTSLILPGYSEVAFNNNVWTENGASEGGDTLIPISNISVGDDASSTQGGSINMLNFPLTPLSQPYALIAEDNPPDGTVPFGLPFTWISTSVPATVANGDDAAGDLPGLSYTQTQLGGFLSEGVIPNGFEVLQLLNDEGSTAVELSNNLDIIGAPTNFAINMQDVSDPDLYNLQIEGLESSQNLVVFVDDGCSPSAPPAYSSPEALTVSGGEVFSIPVVTITNYQNVNIVLPDELPQDGNDVGLGTVFFIVVPSDTELTTTVNFYDNVADTGGSDPGSEDNLYLGQTQTYGWETQEQNGLPDPFIKVTSEAAGVPKDAAAIDGTPSVVIEVNLGFPTPPSAIIDDYGTGRFEIGATDATGLFAQNTGQTHDGGLIMDLPATYGSTLGAGVFGSGENLWFATIPNESGNSDLGIYVIGSQHDSNLLQGSSGAISLDHNGNAYFGATGNDFLVGGPGYDNFFPEGGNDTVVLHGDYLGATGEDSNVWFAQYDVGYSGTFETGTDPGHILEQAITDTASNTIGEQFVDNYGTDLLTIYNFNFTTPGTDQIIFATSSWAANADDVTVEGLVQWNAATLVPGGTPTSPVDGVVETIGSAANNLPAHAVSAGIDVVYDAIGGAFLSTADLQSSLQTQASGDIYFAKGGLAPNHTADLLLAYQLDAPNETPELVIADITIHNGTTSTIHDTDQATYLSVTNLISFPNTGVVGLTALEHHIGFVV